MSEDDAWDVGAESVKQTLETELPSFWTIHMSKGSGRSSPEAWEGGPAVLGFGFVSRSFACCSLAIPEY